MKQTESPRDRIRKEVSKFRREEFALYRSELEQASFYAEYGIGASTVFASSFGTLEILGVETDPEWVSAVGAIVGSRVNLVHADLGAVTGLGRPLSYDKAADFQKYTHGVFANGFSPDLILIDGRFRVASFMASLIHSDLGTRIIFDDFQRARYQVVETVIRPIERTARQALFEKNDELEIDRAEWLFNKFEYVMD